jgi:hypothetical protein
VPLEVTAVSRIHGTRRIHEVTGGHEEDQIRVQEEPRGHDRTREDTPLRRFGTVRHKWAEVLTAKLTAILSDIGNR